MILTELKEIQTIEWSELTTAIDDPKLLVDGKNCLNVRGVVRADDEARAVRRVLAGAQVGIEHARGERVTVRERVREDHAGQQGGRRTLPGTDGPAPGQPGAPPLRPAGPAGRW